MKRFLDAVLVVFISGVLKTFVVFTIEYMLIDNYAKYASKQSQNQEDRSCTKLEISLKSFKNFLSLVQ